MKILLDECVPLDFRHHLPGHDIHTAAWAGLKGLKNGRLLTEADAAGDRHRPADINDYSAWSG